MTTKSTSVPARRCARHAAVAPLALLATSCLVASVCFAAVPGEAIVAYQRYAGQFAVMSPNGGNFSFVACGGDMTHNGSPRYFSNVAVGPNPLPSWYFGTGGPYMNTELVASDEDCQQTVTLTAGGDMHFGGSRWSPDGTMVAAYAVEFDLESGELLNRGIFIADVVYVGNRPVATHNLRVVIPTGGERNFVWSPDSRRIVYVEAGTNGSDLFVYYLDGGYTVNITNTAGVAEDQPAYSLTEQIAYTRQTSAPRGSYRYDIFVIPASGGPERQITSKATTGSFVNMIPSYSPDGQQIAFSSGLLQGDRALYRIRADGSGKAVKVVGSKGQDWRVSFWRQ
jgi:Tol biopolymer transport system component